MKKTFTKKENKSVTYEAVVSLEELKNGLRMADIVSCDDVDVEASLGKCKVQILRDGHIIIHELPKRTRNTPDFRTPRLYVSLDCQDGNDYIGFRLPSDQREDLARLLLKDINLAVKYLNERMYN